MTIDIALTENEDERGRILAHCPDCPMVKRHRREGKPIATLFGCEALPPSLVRHSCLDEKLS